MDPKITDPWARWMLEPAFNKCDPHEYPYNLGECSLDWDYEPPLPSITEEEKKLVQLMLNVPNLGEG